MLVVEPGRPEISTELCYIVLPVVVIIFVYMMNLVEMNQSAEEASRLLKALANPDRLLILCNLAEGERNVTELEDLLEIRQPTLSQQLARLRADHLVDTRRDGKAIYYRLASAEASAVIKLLYELFCAQTAQDTKKVAKRA
jgi:ArsR family transcriptional regulator